MKLSLGKTPEEQAAEEAKKQRERELEIQKAHIERQQKIEALRNKQKVNKIILISTASLLTIALVTFGTYNTFFKKNLTMDDVKNQIYNQVIAYPGEGLDGYIRDVSQILFNEHIGFDYNSYVSALIDKNSVYISRVKKTNNIFSQVYFTADVVMTERDSIVKDPEIIAMLKKGGLISKPTSVSSSSSTPTNNSSTTSNNESSTSEVKPEDAPMDTSEPVSNTSSDNDNTTDISEPTSETTSDDVSEPNISEENSDTSSNTSEPTNSSNDEIPEPEEVDNTNIVGNVSTGSGEDITEYYLLSNGDYMQRGKKTTHRYTFMVPVEYYYNYNEQNVAISSGYRIVGKLELYSLNEVDVYEEPSNVHDYYAFSKDYLVDEVTLNSAKQTVNKIFSDIYAGTVLPQDFVNARTFNTYGATYVRLDTFEFYTAANPLGYNAVATYTIKVPQGFLYTTTVYLTVEPNNTTWKITNMS